jgi:hypothetical protein
VTNIPPNAIAGALQTPLAQRQQARVDDAETQRQAGAARERAALDAAAETEITSADVDSRIESESGGAQGGSGRAFDESDAETESHLDKDEAEEVEPGGRLDITA